MGMGGLGMAAAGGMSLLGGLFGSTPASNVPTPPNYFSPYAGAAAGGAYSGTQNLPGASYGQQTAPLALQSGLNLYNNPYAGGLQGAAGQAGQMGQQAGLNQFGAGSMLGGAGQQLLGGINPILQASYDPQNQLYQRAQGQLQDQTLANLSNAGVGSTPYGQSVLGNTLGNFNIDWQNQQLQRMLQGAQGAGGLASQAGQNLGQMGALQGQAPATFMAGAGMPYGTFGQIGADQLGALQQAQQTVGGAQNLQQTQIQDYLNLAGQGQQAALGQGQFGLNQAQQLFNEQQALGRGVGSGIGGLFGGLGMMNNSGMFGGPRGGTPWGGYNVTGIG